MGRGGRSVTGVHGSVTRNQIGGDMSVLLCCKVTRAYQEACSFVSASCSPTVLHSLYWWVSIMALLKAITVCVSFYDTGINQYLLN